MEITKDPKIRCVHSEICTRMVTGDYLLSFRAEAWHMVSRAGCSYSVSLEHKYKKSFPFSGNHAPQKSIFLELAGSVVRQKNYLMIQSVSSFCWYLHPPLPCIIIPVLTLCRLGRSSTPLVIRSTGKKRKEPTYTSNKKIEKRRKTVTSQETRQSAKKQNEHNTSRRQLRAQRPT